MYILYSLRFAVQVINFDPCQIGRGSILLDIAGIQPPRQRLNLPELLIELAHQQGEHFLTIG